jgi:hypothetical protein
LLPEPPPLVPPPLFPLLADVPEETVPPPELPPMMEPPPLDPDPPLRLGSWVSLSGSLGRGLLGRGSGRGRVGTVTSSPPTLSELAVPADVTASAMPRAMVTSSRFAIPWPDASEVSPRPPCRN